MKELRVALLAHIDADEKIFQLGKEKIKFLINKAEIEFSKSDPDILYFLTGGSEQSVIPMIDKHKSYILLSHTADNSNAAAVEVLAYLKKRHIHGVLINIDQPENISLLNQSNL